LENIMAIKLCHHIKEDGVFCKSAALNGRDYCFFHLTFRGRRMRAAQHRARSTTWRLELPPLEDLNAVQVAIMQVLDAITGDRIERHDAGLVLYGLQQAASNLRGKEGRVSFEPGAATESRCVSYDSFEEDFELTAEDGEPDDARESSVAQAGADPDLSLTAGGEDAAPAVAGKKESATKHDEATSPPIMIDKIHAGADEDAVMAAADADPPAAEGVVLKKPPRGLRPPIARRQSPEEAAALAKVVQVTPEECGRLDGNVKQCSQCEVQVFKRLAQFWEGRKHPEDWLPFTGTMECDDCTYRHLTTLGRHLDEPMPVLFDMYMVAQRDGGEDPGDFDEYFRTLARDVADCGGAIPEKWITRMRAWRQEERSATVLEDDMGEEDVKESA
jgi:hypothetical protein